MHTILFLHGFFASGNCEPAQALRQAFAEKARVLTPDLPIHPKDALEFTRGICREEKPDILVGNSCGSFYAQIVASQLGIPALLGNPHFKMTEFLRERIGKHQYKSRRADGNQDFVIDKQLVDEFEEIELKQFENCNALHKEKVWGIFGEQDTLARYEPTFLEHYLNAFHFPGAHTPTAEEVMKWYVPLIERLLAINLN